MSPFALLCRLDPESLAGRWDGPEQRHAAGAHWWFVEVFACVADGLHGTCVTHCSIDGSLLETL